MSETEVSPDEIDVSSDETGALAPLAATVLRDAKTGRFLPGRNPYLPYAAAAKRSITDALDIHFPPDRIVNLLEKAVNYADRHQSPKAIISIVELILAYQLGKPVARQVRVSAKWQDLLAALDTGPVVESPAGTGGANDD